MKTLIFRIVAAALFVFGFAAPAYSQATRTWVSGVGDDVNPCSRTAPCKTFAGAISKTAAGGEINCLDPGGFGAITITKSITIDCTGTYGSILAALTTGVIVNDSLSSPGTINVILRGITINGAGTAVNGIRFISGRSLTVENVVIENVGGASARGIAFQPATAARLAVTNTSIINNGALGGILIAPTGASGSGRVHLENVRIFGSAGDAMRVDTNGTTSATATVVDIEGSHISGSTTGLIVVATGGTSGTVNLTNSSVFDNGTALAANGANATIRVALNTITGNGTTTLLVASGSIRSFGDNRTDGNSTPPTFTPPTLTRN